MTDTPSESIEDYGRRLLIGAHMNIAADRGSDNPIVQRRAWEKRLEGLCDATPTE